MSSALLGRLVLVPTVLSAACAPATSIVAEEQILGRRIQALEQLLERARSGPLLPEGDVVVAVDEDWAREAIALELPREAVVARDYRVRVVDAEVRFEDGLGLVRLDGRVSPAQDPSGSVFADLGVYFSLDLVELDRERGILSGTLTPLAFEVRSASLLLRNPLGHQLLEELGRQNAGAFSALALPLEIPVRLEETVELPGMGPEGPVEFSGARLPLDLSVSRVTVLDGRLWVSVESRLARPPETAGALPPAAAAP